MLRDCGSATGMGRVVGVCLVVGGLAWSVLMLGSASTGACAVTLIGSALPDLASIAVATSREDVCDSRLDTDDISAILIYNVSDDLLEVALDKVKACREVSSRKEGSEAKLCASKGCGSSPTAL